MPPIRPNRVRHSYRQHLQAPPDRVFPLLCPVRELDWVPGWAPLAVLSESGVAELDCVFVTPDGVDEAIWVITRHEPDSGHVEMIKVTPGRTIGKLEIHVQADGADRTIADVSYTYTALGPRGDAFLAGFTAEGYRSFMTKWEAALNHYLTTGQKIPT